MDSTILSKKNHLASRMTGTEISNEAIILFLVGLVMMTQFIVSAVFYHSEFLAAVGLMGWVMCNYKLCKEVMR